MQLSENIYGMFFKVKSSSFTNSQKSYPPIESGRNINWFSSILRVVTFFNEPIEGRNNTQFSSLNYKQVNVSTNDIWH